MSTHISVPKFLDFTIEEMRQSRSVICRITCRNVMIAIFLLNYLLCYFSCVFFCLLLGPRFFPVAVCIFSWVRGTAGIEVFVCVTQRILFRVYSKLLTPLDFLFRSLGRLLNPSIGPLERRDIISSEFFLSAPEIYVKELMMLTRNVLRVLAVSLNKAISDF